jgi:hypothetical protein
MIKVACVLLNQYNQDSVGYDLNASDAKTIEAGRRFG